MINTAKQLNIALKKCEEAKEYFSLKKQLQEDTYITILLKKISDTQLLLQKFLKENNVEKYQQCRLELNLLKDDFLNYPLVNNYISAKTQMLQILEQTISIISEE